MISKVYISHDPVDADKARQISKALWRVGLESYASVPDRSPEISRADRVSFSIRNSEVVVPVLTPDGSMSRTVNQELGYALGLDRLIVPLGEVGAEMPFFIEHLRPITFRAGAFEDAVARLVRTLRHLTRLEWLKVTCPYCGEEMTQYLTPQDEVDGAVEGGTNLETACSYCERPLSLDPRTFEPLL